MSKTKDEGPAFLHVWVAFAQALMEALPDNHPLKAKVQKHIADDCSSPKKLARKIRLRIYKDHKTTDEGTFSVHVTSDLEDLWEDMRAFLPSRPKNTEFVGPPVRGPPGRGKFPTNIF